MGQPPPRRRATILAGASPRVLWTIVLVATVLTFVVGQIANAATLS